MKRRGFLERFLALLGLGAVVSVGKPSLMDAQPLPGHVLPPALPPCVKCCGTGGRYEPTDPNFYDHPLGPNPCGTGMRIAGPEDGPWVPCRYCQPVCPRCGGAGVIPAPGSLGDASRLMGHRAGFIPDDHYLPWRNAPCPLCQPSPLDHIEEGSHVWMIEPGDYKVTG